MFTIMLYMLPCFAISLNIFTKLESECTQYLGRLSESQELIFVRGAEGRGEGRWGDDTGADIGADKADRGR